MPTFTGQLRTNEVFASLYNQIISIQTKSDNIKGTFSALVDAARVDGSLYGDSKQYVATDVLESYEWGGHTQAEANKLLTLYYPEDPEIQEIVLDVFRQIPVSYDNYLSKRAWGTEGAFTQFQAVIKNWVNDTKRIYDATTYNTFFGTSEGGNDRKVSTVEIALSGITATGEEKNRLRAQMIANVLANLFTDMQDPSRDYNAYKFLRSYSMDEIKVVWNAKYINEITKLDVPTIFHKDGLMDKFNKYALPARYFGIVIDEDNVSSYSASTPAEGKPIDSDDDTYVPGSNNANGTIRTLVELKYEVASTAVDSRAKLSRKDNKYYVHLFPGDEITAGLTVKEGGDFELGEVYIEKSDCICKVTTELPPFMSAFQVGTSFFNPKSLTETNYLTWGHNTLELLEDSAFISIYED